MKIRIYNDKLFTINVVLEPWATEFALKPSDFIDFVSKEKVSEKGFFKVLDNEYGIFVYPEWSGALVNAYDSNGQLID